MPRGMYLVALTKVRKATTPAQHRKKTMDLSVRGIEAKNCSLYVHLRRMAEATMLKDDRIKANSNTETPRCVSMSFVSACSTVYTNAQQFTRRNTFAIGMSCLAAADSLCRLVSSESYG